MPYKDPNDPRRLVKARKATAKYRATPHGKAKEAAWRASPAGQSSMARSAAREAGHNVMPEAREWMLEQQGGACALSGCDRDATDVDHDHVTGEVRGMLCNAHNMAIGHLGDDAEGLRRALQYLSPSSL